MPILAMELLFHNIKDLLDIIIHYFICYFQCLQVRDLRTSARELESTVG